MRTTLFLLITLLFQNELSSQEEAKGQKAQLQKISPGIGAFTEDEINRHWSERDHYPSTRDDHAWTRIGPSHIKSAVGLEFYLSGRARSVDYIREDLIRFGIAGGGLWESRKINGKYITSIISEEGMSSPWIGAMDSSPFDENLIVVGTGEPSIKYGTGIWRTIDGGKTWKNIPTPTFSGSYHEVKFSKVRGKVWATGEDAYYSKDDGLTWTATKRWNISGLAVHPTMPDTAWIGQYADGIYRTYNGGENWKKLGLPNGLPITDIHRIELTICESQPNILYAMYCDIEDQTKGVWKSTNGGDDWTKCRILDANGKEAGIHAGLGWYASFISVSPVNPDHVAVGGFWYALSTNGMDFIGPTSGPHADYHFGEWSKDGKEIYFATDGGLVHGDFLEFTKPKFDISKIKFDHTKIPTLQFVSLSISKVNPDLIVGGTQDNGLVYNHNGKEPWLYSGADGGDVVFHPKKENSIYATAGFSGIPLAFRNTRKTDGSKNNWLDTNFGLPASDEWYRKLAFSSGALPLLLTQLDNRLYYSYLEGDFWLPYDLQFFNGKTINNIECTNEAAPKIFVSGNGNELGSIVMVDLTDLENPQPISSGLPIKEKTTQYPLFTFPKIYVSPTEKNKETVFALMQGNDKDKIRNKYLYKAVIPEFSWKNISGNLPDAPYTSMLIHPDDGNIIIVGTDGFGVYKTEDGGMNWLPFDEGITKGALITDMDYQIKNDSIFVVISTYGCGLYRRYLGSRDVTNTSNLNNLIDFNVAFINEDQLMLSMDSPLENKSSLEIYDINGRLVFATTDLKSAQQLSASLFAITIPSLSKGMYIFRLSNGSKRSSQKAIKL